MEYPGPPKFPASGAAASRCIQKCIEFYTNLTDNWTSYSVYTEYTIMHNIDITEFN